MGESGSDLRKLTSVRSLRQGRARKEGCAPVMEGLENQAEESGQNYAGKSTEGHEVLRRVI